MYENSIKINPTEVRKSVLKMLHRAKASHLGSNMSAIEILIAVYSSVDCSKIQEQALDRSRILVSKGHCAAATYATMAHFGIIPMTLLDTYHLDGSMLTGHVSHVVEGVEHSTGALGHGVNVAVGCALGLRSRGYHDSLAIALVGDGEIQEGSVWEAMMYAVHMRLNNFIVLIDNNKISSITNTDKVINMHPLSSRFEGFGLNVQEVNGHDVAAISSAVSRIQSQAFPGAIICNTVKGRDVPFAEAEPIWHYKSLNDEQYENAIAYLDSLGEV
jgi:transketolase